MLDFKTRFLLFIDPVVTPIIQWIYDHALIVLLGYAVFFVLVVVLSPNVWEVNSKLKYPNLYNANKKKLNNMLYDRNMCNAIGFTSVFTAICSLYVLTVTITEIPITDASMKSNMANGNLAFLTFFLSFMEFCRNFRNSRNIKQELDQKEARKKKNVKRG